MSATRPILIAVQQHLQTALPDYAVDLFPDNPSQYRFIHPKGAVLVGYQGSKFTAIEGLGMIAQQRNLTLALTILGRGVHHDGAALDLLDAVRLAMVGFTPPNCLPCHLISEQFLSEEGGRWQYELLLQTETQQVQQCADEQLPKFVAMYARQPSDPHHPDLTLK